MTAGRVLPICVFSILLPAMAAAADSLAGRYQHALEALEENRTNEELTREERDRLAAEAADLQQRLVANAARVQELEAALAQTETEIDRLDQEARGIDADFARDRDKVAHLLAVLQRMDSDVPPALALTPDSSLGAARGAMVMGSMLPPIYEQAAALARRLDRLAMTKTALREREATARAQADSLRLARVDLDELLQLRNRQAESAEERLADIRNLGGEIAHTARDLKALIDRIAGLRAEAGTSQGMTVVTAQNTGSPRLGNTSLRPPVAGISMPGDPAGPGRTPGTVGPMGLWFEAPGGAAAVAPGDSEVVFAGAYQKFGQVLILEIMGGYHLTLAGLGRIDVNIGDLLLAGEPVGILPEGKVARLYMELRHNGQIVDAAPWMRAEFRKAKGT